MSRLQAFGFKESLYERPNQSWVCGRSAEGRGCNAGPDPSGQCQASFECVPNRKGDRWHCTRDSLGGGRCEDGPCPTGQCSRRIPPCLPIRSVRYRRGRAVRWLFFAVFGGLLLLLSGVRHLDLVSAGDLSFAHGSSATDCAQCHSAAHGDLAQWLMTAFDPPDGTKESRLCLGCHRLGDAALQAHNLLAVDLTALTDDARDRHGDPGEPGAGLAGLLGLGVPVNQDGELACATCHREHQGQGFDLAVISDAECQACHLSSFDSFADGHPEIADYAFGRRTRLAFDHVSHKDKHFPEQEQAFQCATCHWVDLAGQNMLVTRFGAACADCHGAQVEGEGQAGDKGIAVLGVPGLDLEYVRQHGVPIGEWPEDADGEIPPIMGLLLAADPDFVASAERLANQDLLDLQAADVSLADALTAYAWAVKGLFHELLTGGQEALRRRLQAVLDRQLSTGELAALAGTMPPQVIRSAQQAWFPHLEEEMREHLSGAAVPFPVQGEAQGVDDTAATTEEGIVSASGEDQAIPLGSASTVDILGDATDETPLGETVDGDILGGDETAAAADDILGGDPEADAGGDILGADPEPDAAGDILGANAEAGAVGDILGGGDAEIVIGDEPGEDIFATAEDDDAAGEAAADIIGNEEADEPLEPVTAEQWVRAGGWYRLYFTLLYRPSDHDDRFMPGWLDLVATAPANAVADQSHAVFRQLANPKGPGLCTKCHSMDAAANGGVRINWTGLRPIADEHAFTEFNHLAHLSLLDQDGCLLCHSWDKNADGDFMQAYAGTDPAIRLSNFAPFEKATCVRCHRPEMAGDACLTCHNYHVGTFSTREVLAVHNSGDDPR